MTPTEENRLLKKFKKMIKDSKMVTAEAQAMTREFRRRNKKKFEEVV